MSEEAADAKKTPFCCLLSSLIIEMAKKSKRVANPPHRASMFINCTAFLLEPVLQATRHELRVSYRNVAYLDAVGLDLKPRHWVGDVDTRLVPRILLWDHI